MNTIDKSREATVEIISRSGNSKGTGFFVSETHVATCFHVISSIESSQGGVKFNVFSDIEIKTKSGEVIPASCISLPTQNDPSPIQYDFAILKLSSQPKSQINILSFVENDKSISVGSDVVFSGYPLATPAMVTHKGMISGIDNTGNIICIQAPINKGNSGGALIGKNNEVIGVISMREGGISKGLDELTKYIEVTSQKGSVQFMGVDPLQSIREVIKTLDSYISTGIGYAINSKHIRNYCTKNQIF